MKKKVILILAALLLSGCARQAATKATVSEEIAPVPVTEESTAPLETTQATTPSEIDPEEAALAMYDWVLNQYREAKNQGWDAQQCTDAGISYMVALCDGLTYALEDLDGNGNLELMIRCGDIVLDAYTLTDEGPALILSGGERNSYRITQKEGDSDFYILNHGANNAASSVVNVYRLDGTELVLVESNVFDAMADAENPWFRMEGDSLIPISDEEFTSLEETYRVCVMADYAL